MRYCVLILLCFCLFSSCQNIEETKKPANLIPEDKMVDFLTELSLVHGARSHDRRRLEATGLNLEKYLFQKYDIDSIQFAKSNNYYASQPKVYERIYEGVKLRLKTLETKYEKLKAEQDRVLDSIRNSPADTITTPVDSLPPQNDSIPENIKKDTTEGILPTPVSSQDSLI